MKSEQTIKLKKAMQTFFLYNGQVATPLLGIYEELDQHTYFKIEYKNHIRIVCILPKENMGH